MNLTAGGIAALKSGFLELNLKPILQVLGYQKVVGLPPPADNVERFRLELSDGTHSTSSVILSPHLNSKITKSQIRKFAVIRVEEHIPYAEKGEDNLVLLMDLSVILGGMGVGYVMGNPTPFDEQSESNVSMPPSPPVDLPAPIPQPSFVRGDMHPSRQDVRLSEGVVRSWVEGTKVSFKPILQTLRCLRLPCESPEQYSMVLSDGRHFVPAMLGMTLVERARSGEFQNYDVFRAENHSCCTIPDSNPLIIILDISILRCGSEVGGRLGNPTSIGANSSVTSTITLASLHTPADRPDSFRVEPSSTVVRTDLYQQLKDLSGGALGSMLAGVELNYFPVLQVLGHKTMSVGSSERYLMFLSDGKRAFSHALLSKKLNGRLKAGEFADFTVVRVEKHMCTHLRGNKSILILMDLNVLCPGGVVRRRLGNPVLSNALSGNS